MPTLGENIRAARLRAEMTQGELARLLGVERSAVSQWEKNQTSPAKRLPEIARALSVRPEHLWGEPLREGNDSVTLRGSIGATSKGNGVVPIQEVDVRASAGAGSVVEIEDVVAEWQLPRAVVRHATQAPADTIKVLTVVGDSMPGLFNAFDKVLVDTSDTSPSPPGIFVVWDGLGLVLKRVTYIAHSDPPRVRIMSDNPRYDPYERTLGEAYIQGRVLGRWQWLSGSERVVSA